jgi:DNA polymerase-3 subunit epsilon
MGQLDKEIFVCIDCETTGLDPHTDKIIEVAAVRFTTSTILDQFDSLIDPECQISETSIAIHHITQEMVAGKPKMAEILPELLHFIGKSIIVGHGVGFDIQIIVNAAKSSQVPCQLQSNPFFDTLRLARLYGESPINSLERLRQHFNIANEGAHRALSDVLVNLEVFKHLSKKFKTTEQIFEVLSKPILMKTMPLGKHKGRLLKDIPIEYLQWASHKDFDEDLLFSLRLELNRRRKGGGFVQSSNPFSALG